jgi:hypothetical protein
MEEKQFAKAEQLARDSAPQFEKLNDMDNETLCFTILARALASQGKTNDAQAAIAKASSLSQKGGDTSARLRAAIESALLQANPRVPADISQAKKTLQAALADATRENLTGLQLEARLAIGEVETKSGDRSAGRADLAALQKDATAKGFLLIARKASAAAAHKPVG